MAAESTPRTTRGASRTVETALRRIDEIDPAIGAFVEVLEVQARDAAAALPLEPSGVLHGVPVAVKELFDVRGGPAQLRVTGA